MARFVELEHLPIRLTERGRWLHGETPVHPRVAVLFSRHIVPQADGRYYIVLGGNEEAVEVDDAAFFVETMNLLEADGDLERVDIRISDGKEETLDPSSLMISNENVLYARVDRNGFSVPCRFPPSLYHRLALKVEENPDGGFFLPVGGRSYPLKPYVREPKPLP